MTLALVFLAPVLALLAWRGVELLTQPAERPATPRWMTLPMDTQ